MHEPGGMENSNLKDVYARLIQINQETFDGAQYDIAYHALSGALHCAATLKDVNYLVEVERLADKELAWINAHNPEYEHSTRSSQERGLRSIYTNLVTMANAKVVILQNEAKTG